MPSKPADCTVTWSTFTRLTPGASSPLSAAKPPSSVRRLTDTLREPAEIRTRLVADADASAAIVVPLPVRQTFEPSVSGVVVTA